MNINMHSTKKNDLLYFSYSYNVDRWKKKISLLSHFKRIYGFFLDHSFAVLVFTTHRAIIIHHLQKRTLRI